MVLVRGDGDRQAALATSPPSAQRFSIDMNPAITPANTPSTLGTVEQCARIEDDTILNFDEDLVDTIDLDIVAIGIPPANAMTGYTYTLNYDPTRFRVIYQAAKLGHVQPSSAGASTVDPLPDTDGSFHVSFFDTGPPGSEESGSGVLDSLGIDTGPGVQSSTLAPVVLSSAAHVDTNGNAWAPDALGNATIAYDTFCPTLADAKMVSQAILFPAVIAGGIDATMTLNRTVHNNGPTNPDVIYVNATFTLPAGCAVNGQSGTPMVSDSLALVQVSIATSHQRAVAVNCTAPSSNQITVQGCAQRMGFDPNLGNNCETDIVTFLMDSDGDGWTDRDEAGTPLCGDSRNEDVSDDSIVDDGCPGGPTAEGAFSEAQFSIGTDPNDPCGTDGNPADLVGTGSSANRVDITDLTNFLAPVRRYGTSPEDLAFGSRWDLAPGRGLFTTWINISDLMRMIVVKPPLYGGTIRWFGGPACA